MMAQTRSNQADLCPICGKLWNKHTQPEQDSCYRKMHKSDTGTGIG